LKGDRTWKRGGIIGDGWVATGWEESFVESDMFRYDGLVTARKPDKEAGFAMLIARADVDARLAAGGEFALFLESLVLQEDMALRAKNFEVFVWRGEVGMQDLEWDLKSIARARCACATFNIETNACAAKTFAHVRKVKIVTNGSKKLPATIVLGQRVLVLAAGDAETLGDVHVEKEGIQWGGSTLIVAVQDLDALWEVVLLKVLVKEISIDALFLGAAQRAGETANIEGGSVHIDEPLLKFFWKIRLVVKKIDPLMETAAVDKIQNDVAVCKEEIEMNFL
jgi:hypothetical protein